MPSTLTVLIFAIAAAAVGAVWQFADDVNAQYGSIGILLGVLLAVLVEMLLRLESRISAVETLSERLFRTPELRTFYEETVDALEQAYLYEDPEYQKLFDDRLRDFSNPLRYEWREGSFSFVSELWRRPYENLLENLKAEGSVREYRSIAWVKSDEYWQDAAGQNSLDKNYELARSNQVKIHRVFVLRDSVWDSSIVKQMMRDHADAGIKVGIVREVELPDFLKLDLGIYGDRAVGYQYTDDRSRTERFDLHFAPDKIDKAEEEFQHILNYVLPPRKQAEFLQGPDGGEQAPQPGPDGSSGSQAVA